MSLFGLFDKEKEEQHNTGKKEWAKENFHNAGEGLSEKERLDIVRAELIKIGKKEDAEKLFKKTNCDFIYENIIRKEIEEEVRKNNQAEEFLRSFVRIKSHDKLIQLLHKNHIITDSLFREYVEDFENSKMDRKVSAAVKEIGENRVLELTDLYVQKNEIRDAKLSADIEEWFLLASSGNIILQNYFHHLTKKAGVAQRIEELFSDFEEPNSTDFNYTNLKLIKGVYKELQKSNKEEIEMTFMLSERGAVLSKVFKNLKLFSTKESFKQFKHEMLEEVNIKENNQIVEETLENVYRLIQSVMKSNNQLNFNKAYFANAEQLFGKSLHEIAGSESESVKGELYELLVKMAFHYFDLIKYVNREKSIDYTNVSSMEGNTNYILGKITEEDLKKKNKRFLPNDINANVIAQLIYDMGIIIGAKKIKGVLIDSNYIGKIKEDG